jgi:hypothetical protein
MWPARSTARGSGASVFNDKCVRASLVVHVRQQHVAKMSFAYYDDMIDAFPADRTDQPFSISVLPWRAAATLADHECPWIEVFG